MTDSLMQSGLAAEEKFNDATVMQTLLRDARMGLWVIELEDGKAPRMYADESMLQLLGATADLTPEACYEFWYSRVDSRSVDSVNTAVSRIVGNEFAEVYYEYHHPAVGTISIRCGGTRDVAEKRFVSLNGYHQNVTELQALFGEGENLRANNEELLYSLNNLFSSLYRLDPINRRIITMRSPDDALLAAEMDYDDFLEYCRPFLHPDDWTSFRRELSAEHLQELWSSGRQQFSREYRRKVNGEYRWMAFQIYFCELTNGHKWGIWGSRDVHERRSLEEERNKALADACEAAEQSARAKMEFLSHMSHDVRTPINAILGMTTLARAKKDDPAEVEACLDKIENAGNMLYHLINEILDISRADSSRIRLKREPLTISGLVRDSVEMVNEEAGRKAITLITAQDVRHDGVFGDGTRLREIILNYLTNAIKYSRYGGEVHLSVTEIPAATSGNIGYQIDCEDNGIGISEEFLPKVFTAFEREEDSRVARTPGTGLGLAITQNLATLMDGWVSVRSTKGEGSTFTAVVYLEPQADGYAETGAVQAEDEGEISLEGISVLVAEDNEINREIAMDLLGMAGATTDGVENGLEAVQAYIDHGERYDVILMDIKMPVMDGNEATRRIRTYEEGTGRRVPIIALTANSFAEDISASLEAGVDRHLTKPYNQKELFRTIRALHEAVE